VKRLLIALLCCSAGGCGGPSNGDGGTPGCTIDVPDGATEPPARGTLTPAGQRLTPMGKQVDVGGFPFGMAVVPGTQLVIVGDAGYGPEALKVVDAQAATLAQSEQVTSHFLGLAVSQDGKTLYASSPNDGAVLVFSIAAGGGLTMFDSFPMVGLPAGLALSADGASLWVADQLGHHD
jgi:DNA-binding beta-propeller fold protein YncE